MGNVLRAGIIGQIIPEWDYDLTRFDHPAQMIGSPPWVWLEDAGPDKTENQLTRGTENDAWEMVDCTAGEPEHVDKCQAPGGNYNDNDPLTTPGSHYWRPKKAYEVNLHDISNDYRGLKAGARYTLIHKFRGKGIGEAWIGCHVEVIVYNPTPPDDDPDDDPPDTGFSTAVIPIFIHDNGEGAHRYDAAIRLLRDKNRPYEVIDSDRSRVDRLAGVSNSIMPRFFLGDPEAPGWGPSVPKQNNGGLRWLRNFLQ